MANEMRNRLVELVCGAIQTDGCIAHCNYAPCIRCEIIADHLIENGVIVPPCKVGDEVYIIGLDKKIEKYFVEGVCLYQNGLFIEILYDGQGFSLPSNKVFFTKAEAEQKLKEMRGDE